MEEDGGDSSGALLTEDEPEESDSQSESEEERLRDLQEFRVSRLGELRGSAPAGGSPLKTPSRCAGSHADSASREEPEVRAKQPYGEHGSDIAGEVAETYSRNQRTVCPYISSEPSTVSVSQSISPVASSTPLDHKLPPTTKVTDSCTVHAMVRNSSDCGTTSAVKASRGDGYSWRKYGQKQVKSPRGSRSYFRCTNSECSAKKIECSDLSSHTIETVYRSSHNHDPPQKVRDGRRRNLVKSAGIVAESEVVEHPVRMLTESDPYVASRERKNELPSSVPEREIEKANGFDAKDGIVAKQENDNNPGPKPRGKKNGLFRSSSPLKPGKKPKYVVHAAGDVGISADGYRWRKYGQKMVKGNPYPRNYYRCTSAGCPVRKQVETAIDNASAVTITYKGIHDHDKPVPKKRQGPPRARSIIAATPDSLHSTPIKKSDGLRNHASPMQWSVDSEGELSSQALDLGGEKAIESARTLLSIGFEIKPR
ncbi:probable WRKY transcription factor 32 isoform X2 [Rhodamnia argentea]|uniref:Probable WRKY transcription factor 32 isoform X2 n=1 Tax=Rhodamnia argentea TaxID=178133 RepID=A0ABM3H942_9MYRT|nr:probable WRKY transcription factor 32 isoform X2 [Rhodamnia argentea]